MHLSHDPRHLSLLLFPARGPQIRFVEMVIDQLTARGIMDAAARYEAPFSDLHASGPDALFAGSDNVIDGIFEQLKAAHSGLG